MRLFDVAICLHLFKTGHIGSCRRASHTKFEIKLHFVCRHNQYGKVS